MESKFWPIGATIGRLLLVAAVTSGPSKILHSDTRCLELRHKGDTIEFRLHDERGIASFSAYREGTPRQNVLQRQSLGDDPKKWVEGTIPVGGDYSRDSFSFTYSTLGGEYAIQGGTPHTSVVDAVVNFGDFVRF